MGYTQGWATLREVLYTQATATHRDGLHPGHGFVQGWATLRDKLHSGHVYTKATATLRDGLHSGLGYTQAWVTLRDGLHSGYSYTQGWAKPRTRVHPGLGYTLSFRMRTILYERKYCILPFNIVIYRFFVINIHFLYQASNIKPARHYDNANIAFYSTYV